MAEHTSQSNKEKKTADEEISLRELLLKIGEWWRYLLSKWKTIVIAGLLGAVLGLAYSFIRKPLYTASFSFVLDEQKAGGGLSQMSGLASLVGINLGGMEGAGLFTSDNIMEFIKSKRIIKQTLLSKANFEGREELLIDRYVDIYDLRDGWKKKEELVNFKFIPDSSNYYLQDSLFSLYYKDIIKNTLTINKPDKKLNIIQLDIESPDELFSKAFCERLIQNVTDFYIQTRTKKSSENLAILSKQVDSVRRELNEAIGGVAMATDANPNPNEAFQRLRVSSQKRQVDVQANTAILSELVKQQEIAKLDLRNNKPLIQALDRPILPLEEDKIGKVKGIVIGGFLLGFFTVLYLIVKRVFKEILYTKDA